MRHILFVLGVLLGHFASAQLIHVVNEGSSTQKGSVGAINSLGQYTHIDSIPAYGNDFKVHPTQNIYAVVDGLGDVREYYFANTPMVGAPFQTLAASARQMQYHAGTGRKVVTCSERPYFRIYDANNQLVHSLDTNQTRGIAEGIVVVGNKAYFSVNNFGSDSLLQIVDIQTGTLLKTLITRPNPNNLIYDANRGKIYIQIPYYFQQLFEIQELDVQTDSIVSTHTYTNIISYGGFTADQNFIYFSNNNQGSIARVNLNDWSLDTNYYAVNSYGLFADPETNRLYFSETDFVSSGTVSWMDVTIFPLSIQGSVQTHISPRVIGKTRIITNTDSENFTKDQCFIANNQIVWQLSGKKTFTLLDLNGKVLYTDDSGFKQGHIATDSFSTGLYIWQTMDNQGLIQHGKLMID